jgi:hypothetical protein
MKRLVNSLFVAGLGVCAALPSFGAPPVGQTYAELGYVWLTISSDGYDVNSTDLAGRFGYEFSPNFGAEVFGATSASSGNFYGASVKVDNAYGAYFKARVEASPGLELFGKLGWVHLTLNASVPGAEASNSDSSFSYGVGGQYTFTPSWYAQVDYMWYYDNNGVTIKGPSLGVGLRF